MVSLNRGIYNMTDVSAGVGYKINVDGNSFLLDSKKYQLLESIADTGSLTNAAKEINKGFIQDSIKIKKKNGIRT